MKPNGTRKNTVRWLWIGTCVLAAVGIAVVMRRVLIIEGIISSGGGSGPDVDSGFRVPSKVTLLHIIPGLAFMVLGPLQFAKGIRLNHIHFHRYSGWVFIAASYGAGLSALLMPFTAMPLGGVSEAAGSLFLGCFSFLL